MQPSTLTTNQITALVRNKILEETSSLIDDQSLLVYANQVYDDLRISLFTTDQIKSATVALTNGVGTLPSDFGTLYGPGYQSTTDKTPFTEKSIADFDRTPEENAVTIENGQIKVSPATVAQILIKYWPSYAPLSASQDPEINSYFHECIVYGTVSRAHEDLQNEAMAEYYRNRYETMLQSRSSKLSSYQEENQQGNVLFNYQKLL